MKIAAVVLPDFPVLVERERDPSLAAQPVVIANAEADLGGTPLLTAQVLVCSAEARAQGARPGQTVRQALHACPNAVLLAVDRPCYAEAFREVLDRLGAFSPLVEPDGLGAAFLDAQGLEPLFGDDAALARQIARTVSALVGIGPTRFVARLAALQAAVDAPKVVREAEAGRFVNAIGINWLPLAADALERLRQLGIKTIGQFRKLPVNDLAAHLGPAGVAAHRLANGDPLAPWPAADDAPGIAAERRPALTSVVPLETPIETVRQAQAALEYAAEPLAAALAERCQAAASIVITLAGLDREETLHVSPATPAMRVDEIVRQALDAMLKLEERADPWITELTLAVTDLAAEPGRQLDLFAGRGRRRADLVRVAARLSTRTNALLRWSEPAEPRTAPLTPVQVRTDAEGTPVAIRRVGGWRPVTVHAHWREVREWWRAGQPREYYQVLQEQTLLLLVRDWGADQWLRGEPASATLVDHPSASHVGTSPIPPPATGRTATPANRPAPASPGSLADRGRSSR